MNVGEERCRLCQEFGKDASTHTRVHISLAFQILQERPYPRFWSAEDMYKVVLYNRYASMAKPCILVGPNSGSSFACLLVAQGVIPTGYEIVCQHLHFFRLF